MPRGRKVNAIPVYTSGHSGVHQAVPRCSRAPPATWNSLIYDHNHRLTTRSTRGLTTGTVNDCFPLVDVHGQPDPPAPSKPLS
jgi:hypothetical protein